MERGFALFPYLAIEDRAQHLESTADYKYSLLERLCDLFSVRETFQEGREN